MHSETRRPWLPACLAASLIAATVVEVAAQNPAAAAAKQVQQQMVQQMEMRQMMSHNYGLRGPEAVAPLPAFVRIHARAGQAEGMGVLHSVYGTDPERPRRSWIELSGKRWFPKDTDSIRVWDLPGIPFDGNWVFTVASGGITAFTFHPMRDPEYYTRTPTDSILRAGPTAWLRVDSLWSNYVMPRTAQLEQGNGDPVMAIRIINTGRHRQYGTQYLDLVEQAEYACKVKRYAESDSLFALAGKWDAGYPRLHLHLGECKARRADTAGALEAFRYALRYAGTDAGFRKDAERRIRELAPKPANPPPTPKYGPESHFPFR